MRTVGCEKCFPGVAQKKRETAEKSVKFEGSRLVGRVADFVGPGAG